MITKTEERSKTYPHRITLEQKLLQVKVVDHPKNSRQPHPIDFWATYYGNN